MPYKMSLLFYLLFSCLLFSSIYSQSVIPISEQIEENKYVRANFHVGSSSEYYFFKYSFTEAPPSKISAFRFDFSSFDTGSLQNEVLCTFVDQSTSDLDIINQLNKITKDTSSCIGAFNELGIFDGIFEYDTSKKLFVISLKTTGELESDVAVYIRTEEKVLEPNEQNVMDHGKYSMIPFTIHISQFRSKASKVLFYSKTRDMQMYYVAGDSPYPERLFFGNIMSVYTNPDMVRMKYKNADTMILLTRPFDKEEPTGEQFQFQVKFFASDYLLDYYMGTNPSGREKNSPLAINMTKCTDPYYVILNYNQQEDKVNLFIDELYGKIKSISVATSFKSVTWDGMIQNDLKPINIKERRYELPKDSVIHMDVYKIECSQPLLLNFYYTDDKDKVTELNYGQVYINRLKANKVLTLPLNSKVKSPLLTLEVYNPIKNAFVIVDYGQGEFIISENKLVKISSMSPQNSLVIKEKDGDENTRVIVKVGYNIKDGSGDWQEISKNIVYNKVEKLYVFSFPTTPDRYNYTHVLLETAEKASNDKGNVKYCYGTNIGSAILPSSENCYRVSTQNKYTLKVLNPSVMYKDYVLDETLMYFVTLKTIKDTDELAITETLEKYDAQIRNFESYPNVLKLSEKTTDSSILNYPKDNDESVFYQITSCLGQELKYSIYNAFNSTKIVEEKTIPKGTKYHFAKFDNIFAETKLQISGSKDDKIFIKHNGMIKSYEPKIRESFDLSFDESTNSLIFKRPFDKTERFNYTVYVGKEGELSSKKLTLCSFAFKEDLKDVHSRQFSTYSDGYILPINFKKIGLSKGQTFEAIAYIEQEIFSQMSFATNLFTGKVGEIKEETFTEIKDPFPDDGNYSYYHQAALEKGGNLFFSFINKEVTDEIVGALRIELDDGAQGSFNTIQCAWVDDGADPMSMVEAIEEVADQYNSYCTGGKYKLKSNRYNYIFRYSYTKDNKPRRLVIKVPGVDANTGFKIYIRKLANTKIKQTSFTDLEEYGRQEEYAPTYMPYILDLESIRGDDTKPDYVSKVLFYSKHLEMQMYYLDPEDKTHAPMKLFGGNVMLVYTKPELAEQKYHGTKLILLSENIRGQDHSSLGNSFRFHTKMFKSDVQIEYFVSDEPTGRTVNFPLSLEMNTCTNSNNKYYYILNYNMQQEDMNLYMELIFGSIKTARIATEISEEKWDTLISKMTEIKDYFVNIPSRSQHIDIVEIQCNTPLLANVYYNNEQQAYSWVTLGDVVAKNLKPGEDLTFYLDTDTASTMYYSIEVYSPDNSPYIILTFPHNISQIIDENSLRSQFLFIATESITVSNKGKSNTRFIFKAGFGPEIDWEKRTEYKTDGIVFAKDNRFIYKFQTGTEGMNFTDVEIEVRAVGKDTGELDNVKFCYSSSLGMAIKSSKENCFRTGKNIPYTLKFINPNISPKTYMSYTENYYITLTPQSSDYLSLKFKENKYDVKDRNLEGYPKIIKIDESKNKSTILTIPKLYTNNQIIVQLQICQSSSDIINYINYNAYTSEVIKTGNVEKKNVLYHYDINNILMETRLELQGDKNDKVFVKHTGINDYKIILETYTASFDNKTNTVNIIKPIKGEEFTITVFVGKPGSFKDFTLCTFMENDFDKLADYHKTFPSVSSDVIPHYINFDSFKYDEGQAFDLLVYAVQSKNTKLEFIYNYISGTVGKLTNVFKAINGPVQNNVVSQEFVKNSSNYFYYDFTANPAGDVATLRIINEGEMSVTVTKVICTFIPKKDQSDKEMLDIINQVPQGGINLCKGDERKNENRGFDALINARQVKNKNERLLIMVQYGVGENENDIDKKENEDVIKLKLNLRITGFSVEENEKKYNEDENAALVPYVFDLQKIRDSGKDDYISKVLIYSSKRELEMYHLQSGTPQQLFTGNILLVYTNPDVIKEKYQGATTMILLTESLVKEPEPIWGESFRFKTYFFKSDNTMNYYVSSNPDGRPINTPTTMDMPDCQKPYYYILNYHHIETRDLTLHIDKIYGQVNSKKIAVDLNHDDWHDLVENMNEFFEDELLINQKSKYHIDVIETTCLIPSKLHIYYTDDTKPITEGIKPGDTSIINIATSDTKVLQIQGNVKPGYTLVFSFNVLNEEQDPNIRITFPSGEPIVATKNGLYISKTKEQDFQKITIKNEDIGGSSLTRIIFKFGYEIEDKFDPIENQMYHLNTTTNNLYGYKFKTEDDWLNITSVDFVVSTKEDNVKFCYSTSFGAYMEPASQDCYRVGSANTYTLNIINPYLMYKDYIINGDQVAKYYVGFKTFDQKQNIAIKPQINKYQIQSRNLENIASSISITKNGKTILTSPKDIYVLVQLQVCTPGKSIDIDFFNAFNNTQLNHKDHIESSQKIYYTIIENINMDTGLNLTTDNTAKVFVRHIGLEEEYYPYTENIKLSFDKETYTFKFNQPIEQEEFKYTVYIDHYDTFKNKSFSLCSFAENTKIAHYSKNITSSDIENKIQIDFNNTEELKDYRQFDAVVLAEQINNGKLMILSNLVQIRLPTNNDDNGGSNTTLIIIIVVLAVFLVGGGIGLFFFLRKYKNRPNSKKLDAKQTSLAMVDNENEKMIMSSATEKNE